MGHNRVVHQGDPFAVRQVVIQQHQLRRSGVEYLPRLGERGRRAGQPHARVFLDKLGVQPRQFAFIFNDQDIDQVMMHSASLLADGLARWRE